MILWGFKNTLESMFKSGQLPLPKATQTPNNDNNLPDDSILDILDRQRDA